MRQKSAMENTMLKSLAEYRQEQVGKTATRVKTPEQELDHHGKLSQLALEGVVDSEESEDPFTRIRRGLELFIDPNGTRYATVNIDGINYTYEIGRKDLDEVIESNYYELTGCFPKESALKAFKKKLRYDAKYQGETKEVYVRFAQVDDEIYIDLGDKSGRAVHITSAGWQVVTNPPVKFIRYGHMLPLPVPLHNGDYCKLLKSLNLKTKDDELLVLTWPLVAAISSISHAPLILHGAPGACKSGSISALRGLLDPSAPMHTYVQKKVDDAALYIEQNAIPAFDNLTTITKDVENVMCLAATTGSIAKRRLHKNDELVTYKLNRAMLITALELPTSAPDFLDRAIVVALDRVTPDKRRPESQVKREYAQDLPGILGGMCDHLSKMLDLYGKVTLPADLPRMGDHVIWGCVAAVALDYSQDDFINAHNRAALRAQQNALEDDDFATVLVDYLDSTDLPEVEGYVSEVLDYLKEHADECGIGRGVLPKAPNVFSRRLKEITKYLELAGWQCEFSPLAKFGRVLTFTRLSPAEPDVAQEVDLAPEPVPADSPHSLDRDEWSQAFEAGAGEIDDAAENSAPLLTQP